MPSTKRPNFLIIVADDLGYSDISCYGSEIQTPNIDGLSSDPNGLRFTSFHVAAACSPTRSMLLTGVEHHQTGLGQLAEYVVNSPAHQGAPGHEGYLTENVVTISELLRDAGWFTCMAGKWHLGLRKKHSPDKRGFARSYALLPGAANHYSFVPTYESADQDIPGYFKAAEGSPHVEDGEYVDLPDDFYSSDFYADKLVDYLSNRKPEEQEKPFFAYLPFTAPHWPLQAPEESVKPYRGQYDEGPAALRLKRLAALRDSGIIPADVVPHEVVAVKGEQPAWDELKPLEKAKSARAMETYAGMVSHMDTAIGRVVEYLKQTDQYDNTYILFLSDNGAEGSSFEARPILGPKIVAHIDQFYDNSLDNIGKPSSWVWYGTRWAQAATAPSRLHKMFSTEGGCRVPLVWKSRKDETQHHASAITDAFCTVLDFAPTILDLAGVSHPGRQYRNRSILGLDTTARSWTSFLQGPDARQPATPPYTTACAIHPDDEPHGWEMCGSGGLRRGRYKIIFVPFPKGPQKWQLYDILTDPGEVHDLRDSKPELFEELHRLWLDYKERVGVVGVAGEFDPQKRPPPGLTDEFENDCHWVCKIGKSDLPARFTEV